MIAYRNELIDLLRGDLDFHDEDSGYASHNYHSFPAKFPPQLPRKFISSLTAPGEWVLDPMAGSGTTTLEAFLLGRHSIGFDIDPLALKISRVKSFDFDPSEVKAIANRLLNNARRKLNFSRDEYKAELANHWDKQTKEFVDYWFALETQVEILVLTSEIKVVEDTALRKLFELALSSVIITKTGGVSLAFDLAHTRPHRAKVAIAGNGDVLFGEELMGNGNARIKLLTKKLRSTLDEFQKKVLVYYQGIRNKHSHSYYSNILYGNAQNWPLKNSSVDIVVTSPPYAANAIDYMRAHKFSLVWFGYSIDQLSEKRKEYIGGESTSDFVFEPLPGMSKRMVDLLSSRDERRARVLQRYYSEMKRTLSETFRVLKPGKAAIFVVGNSVMRGISTETHLCLKEIGEDIGFDVPEIGVRTLDRNRRMLPVSKKGNHNSQIQNRMHEEYVIGFYKPG